MGTIISGVIYGGKPRWESVSLWGKETNCSIQLTMKTGFYLYTERLDRNKNWGGAGVPSEAERIEALVVPEAPVA